MAIELLTPQEMAEADRRGIAAGPFDGHGLMQNAGRAAAAILLAKFSGVARVDVLCGPGNNGGDGYVIARILAESGVSVELWAEGSPRPNSDAARAAAVCALPVKMLADYRPRTGSLVVDALYGAGLTRPLGQAAATASEAIEALRLPVVAVDLPSGVSGESGAVFGAALRADLTVTFARKKPGHLLLPGRALCGEVVVADIGIATAVIDGLAIRTFENLPALWLSDFPRLAIDTYKYRRGHVGVFSGGPASTGAARMTALGAARAGAGAVTVLSPANALAVNAAHLTSIILRKTESLEDLVEFLGERKPQALVFGPGLGPNDKVGRFALDMLDAIDGAPQTIIIDADGLSSLARHPDGLFGAARRTGAPRLVLTPHDGEFSRLFPDIAADQTMLKLAKARRAAERSQCIVLFKGPDTVIASPDGRAAVNSNGTALLATAGSGDVLAGMIASMAAQGMPAFEAACAATWMHAEAAVRFGPGLIAEDLPLALLPVLREVNEMTAALGSAR